MNTITLTDRLINIAERAAVSSKYKFVELVRRIFNYEDDYAEPGFKIFFSSSIYGEIRGIIISVLWFGDIDDDEELQFELYLKFETKTDKKWDYWSAKTDINMNATDEEIVEGFNKMCSSWFDGSLNKPVKFCNFCDKFCREDFCVDCYPWVHTPEEDCIICMEGGEGVYQTKNCDCKGVYHKKCLKKVKDDKCPTCRKSCSVLYV